MRTVIQLSALVESTSTDDLVEASVNLSAENGQITVEVPEWETRFEVPTEHLRNALQTLAPTEPAAQNGPVTLTMVQSLGQKLSKLEQQIAANPHQRLELEAFGENLEALRREVQARLMVVEGRLEGLELGGNEANIQALVEENKLQGTINASLQGQISGINERIEGEAATIAEHYLSLSVIERDIQTIFNNLTALNELTAPAETAAQALYGGEQ